MPVIDYKRKAAEAKEAFNVHLEVIGRIKEARSDKLFPHHRFTVRKLDALTRSSEEAAARHAAIYTACKLIIAEETEAEELGKIEDF